MLEWVCLNTQHYVTVLWIIHTVYAVGRTCARVPARTYVCTVQFPRTYSCSSGNEVRVDGLNWLLVLSIGLGAGLLYHILNFLMQRVGK